MNEQLKTILILVGVVVIAAGSILYGALTPASSPQPSSTPQTSSTPTSSPVQKLSLPEQLAQEKTTIHGVLLKTHPAIEKDYIITREQLFEQGQWYGALLTYKGKDADNRDTLRVLMEKKDEVWTLRTTPPQPLLATKQYPDVPRAVLIDINRAVSLP